MGVRKEEWMSGRITHTRNIMILDTRHEHSLSFISDTMHNACNPLCASLPIPFNVLWLFDVNWYIFSHKSLWKYYLCRYILFALWIVMYEDTSEEKKLLLFGWDIFFLNHLIRRYPILDRILLCDDKFYCSKKLIIIYFKLLSWLWATLKTFIHKLN